jgi:Transketolase, thiamine diphosphate binding domain
MAVTTGLTASSEKAPIEKTAVNTIRTLAMDAVQAANSGHAGTPMALAPVAYCLWQHFLRFDPDDPIWPGRDRFVLSNGHASMLLYALLYLTGVKAVNARYERLGELSVKLDDIKRFRQLDSKCPGHPEYRLTSGVETTAGPLGQAWATRSAWPRPASGWPPTSTSPVSSCSTSASTHFAATAHDGRHLQRGRLPGRPPRAWQPVLGLRLQSHHHRRPYRLPPECVGHLDRGVSDLRGNSCRCAPRCSNCSDTQARIPPSVGNCKTINTIATPGTAKTNGWASRRNAIAPKKAVPSSNARPMIMDVCRTVRSLAASELKLAGSTFCGGVQVPAAIRRMALRLVMPGKIRPRGKVMTAIPSASSEIGGKSAGSALPRPSF